MVFSICTRPSLGSMVLMKSTMDSRLSCCRIRGLWLPSRLKATLKMASDPWRNNISDKTTKRRRKLEKKQNIGINKKSVGFTSADIYRHSHIYQRLWPQIQGGSVRRRRWETRGWRINWARSPAVQNGCRDPCDNREAAVTTGTSGSNMNNRNKQNIWSDWEHQSECTLCVYGCLYYLTHKTLCYLDLLQVKKTRITSS